MFCLTNFVTYSVTRVSFLVCKLGPLLFTCLKLFKNASSFSRWDPGSKCSIQVTQDYQMSHAIWSLVTLRASSLTRLARSHCIIFNHSTVQPYLSFCSWFCSGVYENSVFSSWDLFRLFLLGNTYTSFTLTLNYSVLLP